MKINGAVRAAVAVGLIGAFAGCAPGKSGAGDAGTTAQVTGGAHPAARTGTNR